VCTSARPPAFRAKWKKGSVNTVAHGQDRRAERAPVTRKLRVTQIGTEGEADGKESLQDGFDWEYIECGESVSQVLVTTPDAPSPHKPTPLSWTHCGMLSQGQKQRTLNGYRERRRSRRPTLS